MGCKISVYFFWIYLIGCCVRGEVIEGIDVQQLNNFVEAAVKCHNNPGVIVSLVKNGKTIFSRGYGITDFERRNSVNENTLFNVASLSKNMAAALLVKLLAENTNLTVESKVRDHLKNDFQMQDDFRAREMTFADILGHRTAVPPNNIIRFDTQLTRPGLQKRLAHLQTPDQFRVKYYYNNLMYGLATYIAEILGKASKLITRHFFTPLGMKKSTFVTKVDYNRKDVAWPYVERYGSLVRIPFEHSRRWGLLAGSVALVTTAEDMTKWMNFHLSKGRDSQGRVVMEEELLNELFIPRMALPFPTIPSFSKPIVPFTTSRDSYTFGLRRGFYKGNLRFSHSGSNHGFRALMSLLPDENVGVFIAMNGRDDNYQFRLPVHMHMMDLALGHSPWINTSNVCSYSVSRKPDPTPRQPSGPLKLKHEAYEGTYYNEAYGNIQVAVNDSKLILTYGWATWELYPHIETENSGSELFYAKGINLTVAYDLDPIEFIHNASIVVNVKATGFEPNAPPMFVKKALKTERDLATAVR